MARVAMSVLAWALVIIVKVMPSQRARLWQRNPARRGLAL